MRACRLPDRLRSLVLATALALAACSTDTPQSLIASGQQFVARKDYKAAVIQFKAALQLAPQSAQARLLLGQALLAAGDPVNAALELAKALDQKAAADEVMPALARALLLSGDYQKLTGVYGPLVLQDKLAMAAFSSTLATAWGALGDKARTTAAIDAALAAAPDFGPARVLQARLLAGRGEFDPALALVDQVLARDGMLYEAWLLKGEILLYGKSDAKAGQEAFRRALAIERSYVPAHLALIAMRLREHDMAGAKAQADELRAALPKHPQTLFVDAQIAFSDGDLVKARELTQQLLRGAPNHLGVLQLAGAVQARLGSLALAESYFAKALQINPELALARRNLARVYVRLSQPSKALQTLQPLLDTDNAGSDAYAIAGEAELRLGDAAAAEAHFTRAARISPDDIRVTTAVALAHLARGDANTAFAELEALAAGSTEIYADQALVSARLKRRQFDAALAAADALVRKAPANAAALELRGRVQIARKDYGAARKAFEQALQLEPSLFSATSNLAAIDIIERQPELARKRLEAAVQSDPRNPYARMALAELRSRNGAPLDEVKNILAEAIKAAPTEAGPRLQLIDLTLRKRQYKEALAVAQEAAAALPNDLVVLDAVGRAQMEAGDVEQAIASFRRLAGADAKSALAYVRLADVFKASGRRSQAEAVLRKALEIDPGLEAAQLELLELLVSANRAPEALAFARRMQQDQPTRPWGYLLEALYQVRKKAPDAAVAALKAGLTRMPQDAQLARQLYKAELGAGHTAEAERFGASWARAHPEDMAFQFQLATTDIGRGELGPAEDRLTRVVARLPNHPLALNNLAWVLTMRGRPGAVAYARRAVDLMPNQPAMIDTLAMAMAAERQLDGALTLQKQAVELAPDDNGLRLNLARIALQAGDKALARKELERLQALGPTLPYRSEVATLIKAL